MNKISVSDLKPGMAFDKPVYLDPENMLVKANEPISRSDIERLNKWNIKEVETTGQILSAGGEEKPKASLEDTVENQQELEEIEAVISNLKQTIKKREALRTMFIEGEGLVKEAYEHISDDKPFQVSRLRNFAENLVTLVDDAPDCFAYLYYQAEEPSLFTHVISAAIFGISLASAIQLSKPRVIELALSILLMKIGMLKVPREIREKTSQLTEPEKQALHAHPVHGYQLLTQNAKVKNSIAIVALQHHEHYDGSGYPRQIKGSEISDYARLAAIADSYSALLENKSYKKFKLPYEAMKELVTLGVYRYDPIFLKAFLNRLSIYPIGSIVKISDNKIGLVAGSVKGKPMRPILMLLREEDGKRITEPQFLHLIYHNNKYISQALAPASEKIDFETELFQLVKKL